jgi:TonB family protein
MIAALMLGLVKSNLAGAAAVVAVLLVRHPVRARCGAAAAYALWLAPLIAAAAVLGPHPTRIVKLAAQSDLSFDAIAAGPAILPDQGLDLAQVVFVVWLAGALAVAGLLALQQMRFLASLGRLEALEGRLRRAAHNGVGPALVGWIDPWIVTPADFETSFAAGERELILAHEAVHLARGDAAANALACAIQVLCWFNPLAHVAARYARIDQELACDAAVVSRFPERRRDYAELLLKTQVAGQPLPLGCHWPAGAAHPLKARIQMLKSPLPGRSARRAGLVLTAAAAAGAGGLAWASQPAPVRVVTEAASPPPPVATPQPVQIAQAEPPQHAPGSPRRITQPDWAQVPTPDDLARVYPKAADQDHLGGVATIDCRVGQDLRLHACRVAAEVPPEDGFGAAALELSKRFKARAVDREGAPAAGGAVRIPIRFLVPGQPAPDHFIGAAATITHPIWLAKPTPADLERLYPPSLAQKGFTATVVLSCRVTADGRLAPCGLGRGDIQGASAPPDEVLDFGTASLQLAKIFRMAAKDGDGLPTSGGLVRIPIRWAQPGAEAPSGRPSVPVQPDWITKPTPEDVLADYPPDALKARIEGRAVIGCDVAVDGKLANCNVVNETPSGAGFGAAAIAMSSRFQMKPMSRDGLATSGGKVRIPFMFRIPSPPSPASAS